MKLRRSIIGLLLAIALVGCQNGKLTTAAASASTGGQGQCTISLVDEDHKPDFQVNLDALEVATERPELQRAYFAMGCFWGSEALLGSAPGVLSTRVGFSGGTLENPTYSAIGDHVETVEVVYDPSVVSYSALLQHFWKHHNSRAKPIFRQYASAVFCAEESEIDTAKAERTSWQESTGEEKVLTAVLPLKKFYPAGDGHQKYYLQQDPNLLDSLPSSEQRLHTILATKLNAVAGRAGDREMLESQLEAMGIGSEARGVLFRRAVWPS